MLLGTDSWCQHRKHYAPEAGACRLPGSFSVFSVIRGSQLLAIFPARGLLAMSRDSFSSHNEGSVGDEGCCYCDPVSKGQGCCSTSQCAQDSPLLPFKTMNCPPPPQMPTAPRSMANWNWWLYHFRGLNKKGEICRCFWTNEIIHSTGTSETSWWGVQSFVRGLQSEDKPSCQERRVASQITVIWENKGCVQVSPACPALFRWKLYQRLIFSSIAMIFGRLSNSFVRAGLHPEGQAPDTRHCQFLSSFFPSAIQLTPLDHLLHGRHSRQEGDKTRQTQLMFSWN